jgi:signal peptidase
VGSNDLAGRALLVVALGCAVLAGAGGGPAPVGYVETGSMAPTLSPGDGFVAVPASLAGPPEAGDVVVYRADRLDGGGLTTHRVVERTDRGLVTKGDANAFTDQSAGEPPVSEDRVVAVALAVGDRVVVLPGVGAFAGTVRGTAGAVAAPFGLPPRAVLVAAAACAAALSLSSGRVRERRRETPVSAGLVVVCCGLAVTAAATASLVVPLGPTTYDVVAAERDAPGPTVVPTGETETTEYVVPGGRLVPTFVTLAPASEGVALDRRRLVVPPGENASVGLALSAPSEPGRYERRVRERRYPLVLPRPVVAGLVGLHPYAPVAVVDGLVLAATALAAALVGGGRPRRRGDGGRRGGLAGLLGGSRR